MKRQKKSSSMSHFQMCPHNRIIQTAVQFTPYEPTQSFISPIISKAEELYLSFMNNYIIGYE